MPAIAAIAARAIRNLGRDDYRLHAWVVMPDHVHFSITPLTSVSALLRSLKGVTAQRIENYSVQKSIKAGALCQWCSAWAGEAGGSPMPLSYFAIAHMW